MKALAFALLFAAPMAQASSMNCVVKTGDGDINPVQVVSETRVQEGSEAQQQIQVGNKTVSASLMENKRIVLSKDGVNLQARGSIEYGDFSQDGGVILTCTVQGSSSI